MSYTSYDDHERPGKLKDGREAKYSPYCDLVYYESSREAGLMLAARIVKPAKPSYIVVGTHGWHASLSRYRPMEEPDPNNRYLRIEVDMRGRAFSDGAADCNGWELLDVIDAVEYAKEQYKEYIVDPEVVYFESGSGGGGNGMAIVGKFPDYFAAATAFCGISDYGMWYDNDTVGEFRDDMDVWIGCTPQSNAEAFRARSGLHLIGNLHTPIYLAHGDRDVRVPAKHSRLFAAKAKEAGKGRLVRYDELPGVGAANHWDQASDEQLAYIFGQSDVNRSLHREPIRLAPKGRLVVGGYVITKHFEVVLDSPDRMAIVDYDLHSGSFAVTCESPGGYTIRRFG
ncbi:hypothetical protein FE783_00390 [Paenibacillus mesophilus]|uniref:alpha/beta hydrolase family protein n=1 Tax=Paenibacillus mesophilus TaxID=2582849 RepID=UPI00110DF415|nr:prolyl oligopeptidase family serine peptidase [Paenibacillus mesophilus]TMV52690.1 hypothetical protein FE783_00390 [Paenibacillus mesophilus]